MPRHHILLVTGGARSGKSRFALARALTYQRRVFLATAMAFDDEMKDRIARHRDERRDTFTTVEEPLRVADAIRGITQPCDVVLLDCLTVWLGNLMHHHGANNESYPETAALLDLLNAPPCNLILVTNEVGMGIVPENPMARAFRDLAGTVNRQVAERADEVVLVTCGLPLTIKGKAIQST